MAEATGLRNNALPYPIYGQPFGISFPILDADGDLVTGATGLDSEVSKNGDTYVDCTNEATEIATSSGTYYLLLTATEMTADVVSIIVKTSSSGAKTTVLTLYPRKLVAIRTGTAAGGATGYITLDSGASTQDDFYNGMVVAGVLDSTNEVRVITDYTGSTKQAAVTPNWNTAPDSDDTFTIYLPEGVQIPQVNATHFGGIAGTFASGRPEVISVNPGAPTVVGAGYVGDIAEDATVTLEWNSFDNDGAPITRATNGTIAVYKEGSTTESTVGVTDTEDYDSKTGCHVVSIDTAADAFYEVGYTYRVMLQGAVIDGITISAWLGSFSIESRFVNEAMIRAAVGLATANLDTQLTAIDDYLDTEVAAIKAKTDNLPSDPADQSALEALITAVDDFVDTEVAAIKAKTDNLPVDPADQSELAALIAAVQAKADAIEVDTQDLQTQIGVAGAGLSAVPKTGFKLASDGLDLVVPADPSAAPTLGTSSIVTWIGYFGAWSVNKVTSDSDSVNLRNTADNADVAAHATSDNGTTFTTGAAT